MSEGKNDEKEPNKAVIAVIGAIIAVVIVAAMATPSMMGAIDAKQQAVEEKARKAKVEAEAKAEEKRILAIDPKYREKSSSGQWDVMSEKQIKTQKRIERTVAERIERDASDLFIPLCSKDNYAVRCDGLSVQASNIDVTPEVSKVIYGRGYPEYLSADLTLVDSSGRPLGTTSFSKINIGDGRKYLWYPDMKIEQSRTGSSLQLELGIGMYEGETRALPLYSDNPYQYGNPVAYDGSNLYQISPVYAERLL